MTESTKKRFGRIIRVQKKENRMVLVDDLVEKWSDRKFLSTNGPSKNSVNSEKTDDAGVISKKLVPCGTKYFKKVYSSPLDFHRHNMV